MTNDPSPIFGANSLGVEKALLGEFIISSYL
jgi:hypothetical protein